jgi:hypothetical protein
VLPEELPGTLHEAVLLQGGGVGTVTSVHRDGGTRAQVQVFAEGQQLMECPLSGTPRVAGAAYAGRFVYIALERGGTWWLEAFDLGSFLMAETRGWPQRAGVSGSRRARP